MNNQSSGWLTWNLGFHFLTAYLITAMLSILTFPNGENLVQMNEFLPLAGFLSRVVLIFSLLVATDQLKEEPADRKKLFSYVLVCFILLFVWQMPALSLVLGGLLGLVAYGAYLYFSQSTSQAVVWIGGIILILRMVYLLLFAVPSSLPEAFQWTTSEQMKQLAVSFVINAILMVAARVWQKKHPSSWQVPQAVYKGVFGVSLIGLFVVLSLLTMARVRIFASPTYDMGIFTQMFANMAKGLGPVTTLERGELMSHFAIHMSPIHYLILPLYALFPSAITLQVVQVAIVLSGLWPLHLILKHFEWSHYLKWTVMFLYLWMPSLSTGHFYDYHENCFLAPLVLWLVYANLSQSTWKMSLVSLLLLMVKEDAAIYVISIGLYFVLQKMWPSSTRVRVKIFWIEVALPLVYFGFVVTWLNHYGAGAMTGRFDNFMFPEQAGLLHALLNAFSQPAFTLASLFTSNKLIYLLIILASQAFLPLFQSTWRSYLLLIPLLLVNLLSDWPYQVDLFKQYHYGTSSLIFFLSLLAIENLRRKQCQPIDDALPLKLPFFSHWLGLAVLTSFFFLVLLVAPRRLDYFTYYQRPAYYEGIQTSLDQIASDRRVLTVSSYTTPLAHVEELYDMFYHNDRQVDPTIDYVIFSRDLMAGQSEESKVVDQYLQHGYIEAIQSTNDLVILERPSL